MNRVFDVIFLVCACLCATTVVRAAAESLEYPPSVQIFLVMATGAAIGWKWAN